MHNEIWKPVVGYEGLYEVSNMGQIRSTDGKVINQYFATNLYKIVNLVKDRKQCTKRVHSIVCEAFHGPRPPGYHAAHNNGNRHQNTALNLGWKLPALNVKDRVVHGGYSGRTGMKRLPFEDVQKIRKLHKPYCKKNGTLALSKRFGVSLNTVHNIVNGATRVHA